MKATLRAFGSALSITNECRTTAARPAKSIGNHIFVLIRGTDGTLQITQTDFRKAFSGWMN